MRINAELFSKLNPVYISALTLFSLIAVTNNKLYILAFLLHALILFLIYRLSILHTLFATLLVSLPFERGIRDWVVEVVPPGPEAWISGYSYYVGFSIKFILFVALILIIFFSGRTVKKLAGRKSHQWILVSFLFASLISTMFAENLGLALQGLFRVAYLVGLYLLGVFFFATKKVRMYFKNLLLIFLLFFGFVGAWQFINRQPIGLFLEDLGSTGLFGYLTTDGERLYRVAGLTGHPTFFASLLSLLLPVGFGYVLRDLIKSSQKGLAFYLKVVAVVVGGLALFATFSRSGWFAITLALVIFLWRLQKTQLKIVRFKLIAPLIVILGISFALLAPLFFSRLDSLGDLRNIGNLKGRLSLIKQSELMVQRLPVFGVGLNHFTKVMSEQKLSLEERAFLYPVHNTFLLFFSETGVISGLLFLAFVVIGLYHTWKPAKEEWVNFGIWVGALTFLVNAQFHTLFSQDPTLDTFMIMLAYLSVL